MGLKFANANAPLSCVYGMTWSETVILTDEDTGEPIDLTGVDEILMRIRDKPTSAAHLLELSSAGDSPALSIVEPLAGTFAIAVPKEDMQALPDPGRRRKTYFYDCTLIRGAVHEPGVKGKFRYTPNITRAWQAT